MSCYKIIGLMSGTSMDGVDLTYATYTKDKSGIWHYQLIHSKSFSYEEKIQQKLSKSTTLKSSELHLFDRELGRYYAKLINNFISENGIIPDEINAIASHGHTVFHQPEKGFTVQIGSGIEMAVNTGIQVINDFRSKDVALNGQGAPLVPIGDKLLFNSCADAFINIGGFTNVSFPNQNPIIAFDICPGNLPLNRIMQNSFNKAYDDKGGQARKGKVDIKLFNQLNKLKYYQQAPPKSLGTEWLDEVLYPQLAPQYSPNDLLCTLVEHIAYQISRVLKEYNAQKIILSGGGAMNKFLVERIIHLSGCQLVEIDTQTIEYKEAIIFGFLGALFLANEINILKEVTGAKRSSKSGTLHLP